MSVPPRSGAERWALTVVTDPDARIGLVDSVRAALRGGAPTIQLRWKNAPAGELLRLARLLRSLTHEAGALLIVNDRLDVAMMAGADGVHLGADDLSLEVARRLVGRGFILGSSADTAQEALAAERAGADYVGIGPIFPTATKDNAGPVVGVEGIREARAIVGIPVLAIGGIGVGQARAVVEAGADGVAVVSAVMAAADPESATRELLREIGLARTTPL